PLGAVGKKTIRFADDGVEVKIEHPGKFTEQIPLVLKQGDGFDAGSGVTKYGPLIVTHLDHAATVSGDNPKVFGKQITTLSIVARDSLTYTISIGAAEKP